MLLAAVIASTIVGAAHPADLGTPTSAFVGGPVRVQACDLTTTPIYGGASEGLVTVGEQPNLRISFVNTAGSAANSVRFTLRANGQTETIVDKGNFSTGTTIVHDFEPSVAAGNAQCSVEAVSFADGSSWSR